MNLIADLIHSCSNEKIAQAAVASIGGGFAERVRAAACENGVSPGRFVAVIVRDFGRRANEQTRHNLRLKIAGADQPILFGLRHIIESALEEGAIFFDDVIEFGHRLVERNCFSAGAERLQ
jgi:hypothetical protein